MYIAINDTAVCQRSIISVLPQNLRRVMYGINLDEAEEIRLIQGKAAYIKYPDGDYYITHKGVLTRDSSHGICITEKNIAEAMERVTKSSVYSVKNEIKNGYITIDGGHRVGIAGTAVVEDGEVQFIKNISAMNIRIANEVIGCADKIIDDILNDGINSTLIISPPGCGKTTMLRDIVRILSHKGYSVAVADERCEICAMYDGESAFDIGGHTTVLENCPKAFAMTALLRSMSPEVIVTDELGGEDDADAVYKLVNSGISVIATAHARTTEQLMRKKTFKKLISAFDLIVTLSKKDGAGTVEAIEKTQCLDL